MGTVTCRACKGSGRHHSNSGKSFDCRACSGTGINRDLWSTRCDWCRTEIVYKANTNTPRYCKDCRNKQQEKTCPQPGCTNTIRYQLGWNNVPTYCKHCETKRAQGWSSSVCPGTGMFGCGKLIWSPPDKRFNLCSDCNAKKRAADEAKWKTKRCKSQSCSNEIRYHEDWNKVPDYCKDCNEWRAMACAASGCNNQVKYKKYWDNIPNYCPDHQKKQRPRSTKAYVTNIEKHDSSDNYRITMSDGAVITFGPSASHGADHWFVSIPDESDYRTGHTSFIVKAKWGTSQNTDEWFIQQIKARGADKDFWKAYAVAVLGS